MKIKADLHMHTALSPCGSLDNSPVAVVRQARACGLDVIAVTDHNAMENCFYAAEAGKREGVTVLYGMEAQTSEDIHILCYFDDLKKATRFYEDIYPLLPDMKNNPDFFGDQVVVDLGDNILRVEEKLLLNSLVLSIGELVEKVKSYDGFYIPAHIASQTNGLMMTLGFVPIELRDTLLEVAFNRERNNVLEKYPELKAFPIVSNSDAHYLKDIARSYTVYDIAGGIRLLPAIFEAGKEKRFQVYKRGKSHDG